MEKGWLKVKKYSGISNIGFLLKNIIKTDKKLLFIIIMCIPIGVSIPLLEAYLPKVLIDSIQGSNSLTIFFRNIVFILGALLLLKLIDAQFEVLLNSKGAGQRVGYMVGFFKKNVRNDYEYTSSKTGLEEATKAMDVVGGGDGCMVQQFSKYLSQLIISLIGIVLFGAYIIKIQPVLLVAIILSGIINYVYGRFNVKIKEQIIDATKEDNHRIKYLREKTGDLRFSKDMRLYRMNEWFFDTYQSVIKRWYRYVSKERNFDFLGECINILMIVVRDGLAYMFLIINYLNNRITISQFVLLLGIVKGFSDWVMGIIAQYNTLKKETVTVSSLRSYLDREDGLNRSTPRSNPSDMTIELRNVAYKYQASDDAIIKNLNLVIKPGEKLAIVGVNGAGKTTLISLIMGLLKPTSGEILLGGKNINEYNIDEYYGLFSTVFQDVFLLPETIEDFIACGNEIKDQAKIDKVLQQVGLLEVVSKLPNNKKTFLMKSARKNAIDLSGGQNQKLLLARALYKDAKIIILDEPTAALDPIAESEIYEGYYEMTKNKTAIFISHRLSSTKFCDRIIFMENGRIVEVGTHKELMNSGGKYKEMFDIQAYYYQDEIGGEGCEATKAC